MNLELLLAQIPTVLVLVGALLHMERRLTRIETDLCWLRACHTREQPAQNKDPARP